MLVGSLPDVGKVCTQVSILVRWAEVALVVVVAFFDLEHVLMESFVAPKIDLISSLFAFPYPYFFGVLVANLLITTWLRLMTSESTVIFFTMFQFGCFKASITLTSTGFFLNRSVP